MPRAPCTVLVDCSIRGVVEIGECYACEMFGFWRPVDGYVQCKKPPPGLAKKV